MQGEDPRVKRQCTGKLNVQNLRKLFNKSALKSLYFLTNSTYIVLVLFSGKLYFSLHSLPFPALPLTLISSARFQNARYKKECTTALECMGFQDLVASSGQGGGGSTRGRAFIGGANLMMLDTTPVGVLTILLVCGRIEVIWDSAVAAAEAATSGADDASNARKLELAL